MKKTLSIILALTLVFSFSLSSFAVTEQNWDTYWETEEAQAGVTMFPGSDETGRNFSWYSEKDSKSEVVITDVEAGTEKTFSGTAVKTYSGDYANKVSVTGLEKGKTYTYQCISEGYTSDEYTFTTSEGSDFSAMYVTDVHVSYSDEDENCLKNNAELFGKVIDQAEGKQEIDLLLSAGDQASAGLECEYKGFTASPAIRTMTVATALGNHDRKGVDYKTFKNMPNEQTKGINTTYNTGDYWFVKGDVLFLVLESNNGSGIDHHNFLKSAINANKDVKWRVAVMHHDLYSGRIIHRESENELLRLIWGPMQSEFDIDLVLTGHSHYYTVSDVLYNGKIKQETGANAVLNNPEGTVYMVSGSINRPRNDKSDDLGLNETVGYYYEQQEEQVLYNIIDFSEDSIKVSSYSYDTGEVFNTLTITKDSQQGGHPQKLPLFYSFIVNFLGTVYQFFNNISVYTRLKDDGIDVNFFEIVFNRK